MYKRKRINRKLKKVYQIMNKNGVFFRKIKKNVILFLLCYQRSIKSKNIVISPYIVKRICYPILKLGYSVQYRFEVLQQNIFNKDFDFISYLVSYKYYYLNKKLIKIYNTNIDDEYIKYKKKMCIIFLYRTMNPGYLIEILNKEYKDTDKEILMYCLSKLKINCLKYDKTSIKWNYYLKNLVQNLDNIILNEKDILILQNI